MNFLASCLRITVRLQPNNNSPLPEIRVLAATGSPLSKKAWSTLFWKRCEFLSIGKKPEQKQQDLLRGLIDKIVLTPKASGTEYAIDLHGDLAGILTVAAGKHQKISDSDPLLQQVKMMTESGDQKHGWQEDSNDDEISSKEDLSDKNEMVNLNARSSRKSEPA